MTRIRLTWIAAAGLLATALTVSIVARPLAACPFCSAIALTFAEEINGADVAVIARLVEMPPDSKKAGTLGGDAKAKFEILEVLKGEKALGKARKFEALYFGREPVGATFLVMGVEPPAINWATPVPVSERGRAYLAKSVHLPKEGPERLAFFQDYLQDEDEMLSRDAFDEFAKTPYGGLKEIKDILHHDKIVGWVQNPKIEPSRKNLFWMMLGICGKPEDLELFEQKIRAEDKQIKSNALLASYLTLKAPDGLKLLEDLFLKKADADYIDTYATVIAIRFQGQEEKIIPQARLLEALRYMLDRPELADLVITDLGRWQDWTVMDRLVELFKNADEKSIWVRVPVISYLRACPLPEAKEYITELAKIDPDAVKRASSLFPLGPAAPAVATNKTETDKSTTPVADDKKTAATDESGPVADSVLPDDAAPSDTVAPKDAAAPDGKGAPKGKKVSDRPAAPAPAGKKTSQSNKPIVDEAAAVADNPKAKSDHAMRSPDGAAPTAARQAPASQTAARTSPRLSRSGAPGSKIPQVGVWPVLGGMTLAAGVLSVFLVAILRGGQEAAS